MKPTVGSLFAGIGGFDLGFERAGFETVWQVEIDEYCRRVLERHFPRAERFGDIRDCGAHNLKPVDIICGGFPCQDVSHAGPRIGIDGGRSGLWSEMFRIICELRPRIAVVENVTGLLDRGMGRVLAELAGGGFDAEWFVLSGCVFGSPHPRERVFVVAYPQGEWPGQLRRLQCQKESYPKRNICWTKAEPDFGRMADGVPNRVDRLVALGNAVMPDVTQWIAERIKAVMEA